MTTTRRIFLSYRREDAAAHAGWLAAEIRAQGAGEVFLDVDTIALGENFVRRIEREIERCDAVLVLIGRDWLTPDKGRTQPRLFDELDWVRLEIQAALERGIPVVPVLVEGARMPNPSDLPEPVRELAYRAGTSLREASWTGDVARMVAALPTPTQPVHTYAVAEGSSGPTSATNVGRRRPSLDVTFGDTVIVPARSAYAEYLEGSAYVCRARRSFRETTTRMGFYFDRLIRREVPTILDIRDDVPWTRDHARRLLATGDAGDAAVGRLIKRQWDARSVWFARRHEAKRYKVFLLSAPDDPATMRMDTSVRHAGASAWTQNQRYISSTVLRTSPHTTDEL